MRYVKIFLLIAIVFLCLSGCNIAKNDNKLQIKQDESYLNDFTIKDNSVYFYCNITVTNNSNEDIKFSVDGQFTEDYKSGLITEEIITGISNDNNQIFSLEANETNTFEVVFIGNYGGTDIKSNRLLPDVTFKIIK